MNHDEAKAELYTQLGQFMERTKGWTFEEGRTRVLIFKGFNWYLWPSLAEQEEMDQYEVVWRARFSFDPLSMESHEFKTPEEALNHVYTRALGRIAETTLALNKPWAKENE